MMAHRLHLPHLNVILMLTNKNMKLNLILVILLLNGCSTIMVQNPSLNDLSGVWEASGPIPYAKLIIEPYKENLLIVVKSQEEVEVYKIKFFKPKEYGFGFEIVNLKEKMKSKKMNGVIIFDRVVLSPEDDEKLQIWFVKSDDLAKYQGLADKEIKKYNNSLRSNKSHDAALIG